MITRAGALLLVGAVITAVGGRLLGLVELYVLAGAAALLVGLAAAQVAWARPRLLVHRSLRPGRVHVGAPARIEVEVTSAGRRRTPVIGLVDPVGGSTGARLLLAPLDPGGSTRATYRLPTRRRGEVKVGPLRAEVADPFRLAHRDRVVAERTTLLVLPRIDPVPPLPRPPGSEPLSGHDPRPDLGRAGTELHSLRPYVVGDDIRRVHWPASAKVDDLVVRLDDEPRQGRVTVALDVQDGRADPDGFEEMVSAAASIAATHWQQGDTVRLLLSDGRDSGRATGQAAFDVLLEMLAVTRTTPAASMGRLLGRTDLGHDSVIAVVGALDDVALASLPSPRRSGGRAMGLTVVRFGGSAGAGPTVGGVRTVAGIRVVEVDTRRGFAPCWEAAVATRRRQPGIAVGR